ncbi:glycosyltransferase [Clostridium omnivorum]|uniref:Glycoside hydrolase n=1 Tax=Clostridium omnivorum TaxID=1604902 RepID=A0ABQ5N0D9_9CLOT|nr:glycosyltransferase [Clostridium sp. E14]GLC28670.1 glycoside hydrolase [Clostridium sp. E14]
MFIIKVLQIISSNDIGGGANHVLNICTCPKNVFESTICCIGSGPLYKDCIDKGISAVNFSIKEILNGKLNSYIEKNKFDLLNYHGARANFTYLFSRYKLRIPAVVTLHSDYRMDFINDKKKYHLFTPLNKIALKKFKYYVCVSNHLKKVLDSKNFSGDKYVVNNGIKINNEFVFSNNIREKYNIAEDEFVYVMVARMHPVKNHKTLIEAFKLLRDKYRDVKLLLVGDGELEPEIKLMVDKMKINDSVVFAGYQVDTLEYYNAADISILTSFSEGGSPPLVILESGLVKKSVIASKVGDMEEIINNRVGILVNPNSPQDVFEKMEYAYLNKIEVKNMGQELYNMVVSNFSLEQFWRKYKNIYNNVLNK